MTDALFAVDLDATDFAEGIRDAAEASDQFEVRLDLISKKLNASMDRFFAFVRKGTGETAKELESLEGRFASLEARISTAAGEGGAVKGFVDILGGIADESRRGSIAINTLGASIGLLVTPLGPAVDLAERLADALARLGAGQIGGPTRGPGIGSRATASERARLAALGDVPAADVVLDELPIIGDVNPRRRGSSGGNNLGSLEQTLERASRMGEAAEDDERRTQESYRRIEDAQRASWERRLETEKDMLEAALEVQEKAYQRRIDLEVMIVDAQKKREDAQIKMQAEEAKAARANAMAIIDITGGLAQTIAGDHAGANWIKAGTETLDALLSIPNWVEVARHGANAIAAGFVASQDDSRAGPKRSQGPISLGGGSGGGGGGGGSFGGGGFAPGGGFGGGFGPQTVVVNVYGGQRLSTDRDIGRMLTEGLGAGADAGYYVPERALPERRR